jgi:formylglycine-generating enzyme required for sulfatase activity
VTLTKGYWLADSDCTIALWYWTVMQDGQWRRTLPGIDEKERTVSTLPMAWIDFDECQQFLKSLNTKIPGLNACLPTEAQWEYACRAGTTGPFAGDLNAMAWMYENSDHHTHPVKTKAPNAWGLYDMHGNVYNWCQDSFADFTSDPATDPLCTTGTGRIIRGGSYYYHSGYLRSASRWGIDPNAVDYPYIGFRICVPGDSAAK